MTAQNLFDFTMWVWLTQTSRQLNGKPMGTRQLLAIALIGGGLFWPTLKEKLPELKLPWQPAPAPSVVVPDAATQQLVEPVRAVARQSANARKFAEYWADMAKLVELKPGVFPTTGAFQTFHKSSSALFIDIEPGEAAGMAKATEAVIFAMLGAENAKLEDAQAKRCFLALSWACSQ